MTSTAKARLPKLNESPYDFNVLTRPQSQERKGKLIDQIEMRRIGWATLIAAGVLAVVPGSRHWVESQVEGSHPDYAAELAKAAQTNPRIVSVEKEGNVDHVTYKFGAGHVANEALALDVVPHEQTGDADPALATYNGNHVEYGDQITVDVDLTNGRIIPKDSAETK